VRILRVSKFKKHFKYDGILQMSKILSYLVGCLIIVPNASHFQIHWCTCYWYLYAAYLYESQTEEEQNYLNSWLPTNIRTIGGGPSLPQGMHITKDYVHWFYQEAQVSERYVFTLYSMIILVLGGNIAPANDTQVHRLL
jgi:hypothetical protein